MLFGQKQYQAIAYVNNIIDQTENAKFEHAELPLMRGECYGLRAFMHFDLCSSFAEDYGQSNASTRGGVSYQRLSTSIRSY